MKMSQLGRTKLEVSPICIGAWQLAGPLAFGGEPDGHPDPGKQEVLKMIRALGDRGINFIDTAEQYGNGESERRVGEALEGDRDQWIISTKFGYRVGPDGQRDDSSSPDTIVPSIEGSLRRLKTDYIDIYLFHCPPAIDELDAAQEVLDRLVEQGKCRFYGISTNSTKLIEAMIKRDMLDVLQYHSNVLQDAATVRALIEPHNIGTQVRGVMAQGRLSGKYFHHQPAWRNDDNRSTRFRDEDFRRYAVFEKCIPECYSSMAQVAMRWELDQPCNHSLCLGAKKLEDYDAALKAIELPPLSSDERGRIAACAASLSA